MCPSLSRCSLCCTDFEVVFLFCGFARKLKLLSGVDVRWFFDLVVIP